MHEFADPTGRYIDIAFRPAYLALIGSWLGMPSKQPMKLGLGAELGAHQFLCRDAFLGRDVARLAAVQLQGGFRGRSRAAGRPPRSRGTAREPSALHAAQGVGVACVHVGDFAGDAGGEVRQQEGGGVAHFLDGDVAVQRGGGFDGCQDAG